jgi:hypothetical protein
VQELEANSTVTPASQTAQSSSEESSRGLEELHAR